MTIKRNDFRAINNASQPTTTTTTTTTNSNCDRTTTVKNQLFWDSNTYT